MDGREEIDTHREDQNQQCAKQDAGPDGGGTKSGKD
jgi:hypothetical protein